LEQGAFDDVIFEPGMSEHPWYSLTAELVDRAGAARVHFATAFASSALSRRASEVGAYSLLVKPVAKHDLVQSVVQHRRTWVELSPAETLACVEWEHINELLYLSCGNVSVAARRLGIPRQSLYRKLRKHSPMRAKESDERGFSALTNADGLPDPTLTRTW
jgi:two-component system, response regulator RegA